MTDFLKYRYASFALSLALLASGLVGYVMHGGFRYSVDFTGGTQVLFRMSDSIGSEKLKSDLSHGGWSDAVIREFSDKDVVVRVKEFSNDSDGLAQKIKASLERDNKNLSATILEANGVGPGVGESLRWNSIWALALGLLLMLLYVAWRFWSFSFGVGAVIAILHDALAILAVFALLNREISPNIICAILATLGYSINDTIVIFSRIRENAGKMAGTAMSTVVNSSINQTMRRTMLTSLSTGLVVSSLMIFGGESLRNLSLALMVGIVVGTYSSVCIASPLMLMCRKPKA